MEVSDVASIEGIRGMSVRVLCIHKPFEESGGIGRFFSLLKGHFQNSVDHFQVGSRNNESFLFTPFRILLDYCLFYIKLRLECYNIVHINVSFNFKSVIRDGIFILLVPRRTKLVIHFHGWYSQFVEKLTQNSLLFGVFKYVFGKANAFIIIVDKYRSILKEWGFDQKIYTVYTAVDTDIVKNINLHEQIYKRLEAQPLNILFLSRIVREKGIYETIDGVTYAVRKYNLRLNLIIAGDGKDMKSVRQYALKLKKYSIPCEFSGYVTGNRKSELYSKAFLYCLPSYNEGMPLSVLEGMIFGLPVIVSKVGQLPNVLNATNGILLDQITPECIGDGICTIAKNPELYSKISLTNFTMASTLFNSDKIAESFDVIYNRLALK